jgi:hypothetical protein
MKLELVRTLQIQRDLYDIPRGMERFHKYVEMMTGGTGDIALPLPAMNPMGKELVAAAYDALIALDAEAVAAEALAEAERRLGEAPGEFRVCLVVSDDAGGGWTNRYLSEATHRFQPGALTKRSWIVVLFWTGDDHTKEKIREDTLMTAHRIAHIQRNGAPKTLGQMMDQEGRAAAFADARGPTLDEEDMAYTREVIKPYLETTDYPTIFACLYGDKAAKSVGYPPLGLSERAGFALALEEARSVNYSASSPR